MTVTGGTPWPPAEGPGDRPGGGSGRHRSRSKANEQPGQQGHPDGTAPYGAGEYTGGYELPTGHHPPNQAGANPTGGGYVAGPPAAEPTEDWEAEWAAARKQFGAPPLPQLPPAGTPRHTDDLSGAPYTDRGEPGYASTPDTGNAPPHWSAGRPGDHTPPPDHRAAATPSAAPVYDPQSSSWGMRAGRELPSGATDYPSSSRADDARTGQYAAADLTGPHRADRPEADAYSTVDPDRTGQYATGQYAAGQQTGTGYARRQLGSEPGYAATDHPSNDYHSPDYGAEATGEYSPDEQTGHFDGFGAPSSRGNRRAPQALAAAASEETGEVPRDRRGRPQPTRAAVRRRARRRRMLEWPFLIAFSLLAAVLIRTFVLQTFYIPSPSMHPTLLEGDRVLVNKLSYRLHDVNRGDVVVFRRPANLHVDDDDLIKRVIGLPGDTVEAHDRKVYVNGRLLKEPYIPSKCKGTDDFIRVSVPSDHLFVMGDNRCDSTDSRVFGPISEDLLVGRAFVRLWPPSRLGWL